MFINVVAMLCRPEIGSLCHVMLCGYDKFNMHYLLYCAQVFVTYVEQAYLRKSLKIANNII